MSLETIKSSIENRLKFAPSLGYVVAINLGDDGVFYLDGHQTPTQVIDHYEGEADTTLSLSEEKMQAIIDGKADANMAVLMGQLKVSGKLGVAMKLASYLEE